MDFRRQKRYGARRRRHFSLIELMIVLIIISLLATLVGPTLIKKLGKAKRQTAQAQIRLLANACKDYYLDMDRFPERLESLIQNPSDEKWDGPYLDPARIPEDPWGNEYHYQHPGDHGEFDIYSYGADNAPGGEDENADVSSWE